MAELWARAGINFNIDDDKLKKVKEYISAGDPDAAREILSDAMLGTYTFTGENYIPDNDDCTAGIDELRDFSF